MKRFDRYLIARIAPILAVAFLLAGVMLFMERLLRLLDMTIGTGISVGFVLRMLVNLTPHYIQLILPIGLFIAVLLTFRDLSVHSEFSAMQLSGFGIGRLIRAPAVLGLITSALGFAVSGYIEPVSRYTYHRLGYDVQHGIVRSGLEEGSFITLPNGYVIRAARTQSGGTTFVDFFGYKSLTTGGFETVTANSGVLVRTPGAGEITLMLFDGVRTIWSADGAVSDAIAFDTMTLPFDIDTVVPFRGRGVDVRELLLDELARVFVHNRFGATLAANPGSTLARAAEVAPREIAAELHGRLIYTLSIIAMPFLAAPFAIVSSRSIRSGGLIAGLVVLMVYQKTLEFGEEVAAVTTFPIGSFLWGTFAVFAVFTAVLFAATARTVGNSPYQRFEDRVALFLQSLTARGNIMTRQ